jgi:hypothetical protein
VIPLRAHFDFWSQWLYFKKLEIAQLKDDWVTHLATQQNENSNLAELWVLADKLGIPQLQNVTMETMHQITIKIRLIPAGTSKYIYNNTSPTIALRRYVVELCAISLSPKHFSEHPDQFLHVMLIDMVTFYSTRYWSLEASNKILNISDYRVPDDMESKAWEPEVRTVATQCCIEIC